MYQNIEYKNQFRILKGGLISLVVASNLYGSPSGGIVVSGNANISQSGNTTNINQSSQKASINWQDFSIKSNEIVNFNQPNQNSITLNRVVGNEKSIIDGALNANGQVWILNQNGTLFGKNAKVNTSGLLVTTKELSDDDFQKGNYSFKGNSKATIENLGEINSEKYASFIANSVINNGKLQVYTGNLHLIGANDFSISLDENSNISLKVTKGVLDALVENNHLLIANGGNVYLTTNAKDELLKGVVNNKGVIEANSLEDLTGKQSEVILFAHGGTANIDGEIKAKNSFVETSGEKLSVKDSFKIEAKTWLLDSTNIVVGTTNIGNLTDPNGDVTVSNIAIQNALNSGNTQVKLEATNNITVNENISWSTESELRLKSDNINVNATINNTNSINGGVYFEAQNTTNKVVFGTDGKVIVNNIYQLQWLNTALGGKYELGSNINASVTSSWNSNGSGGYYGFNPIGELDSQFTGTFDGKGFTISDLYINRPNTDYIGLFRGIGTATTIKNLGLVDVSITGNYYVGGLVGDNLGTITNSYASGTVSGTNRVGGLVGDNLGTITNSYSTGTVSGSRYVGGLVGWNYPSGTITNSYSTGTVSGNYWVGGLVGNNSGTITNSYSTGTVSGNNYVGGLVGYNYPSGTITNSYASGTVTRDSGTSTSFGGLVGLNNGTIQNSFYDSGLTDDGTYGRTQANIATALTNASSEWETDTSKGKGYGTGTTALPFLKNVTKLSNTLFEDGLGTVDNPYTITNWTQLQNINNSNILTQNYYFNLINNLDSSSTGYMGNSGAGWNPIGNNSTNNNNSRFKGRFDGLGNTISDLYINRPNTDYIGLFGVTENSLIRNIGLLNVNITGDYYVGGLVAINDSGTILNSYSTGMVSGNDYVGGLVGRNSGTISNSYATGSITVTGNNAWGGGLVGFNASGTIENSYASSLITGNGTNTDVGGLVGRNTGIIQNSFYDRTKYTGDGVGSGSQNGVTGKTTKELSYGGTFKSASTPWDIIVDSSVTSLTPIRKWDSVNNKYVWAIAPISLTYNLGTKSTIYNGNVQNLSSFYTTSDIFGSEYNFLNLAYKFQKDGNDVTGYKNAGTYSNIKVVSNNEFLTIANSGNTDGNLTITPKAITVNANNQSKIYGETNPNLTYSLANGSSLVGNDTLNGSLETTANASSNVGIYDITKGTLDNSNYAITFNNGTLTVLAQNIPTPIPVEPKNEIDNNVKKLADSMEKSINKTTFKQKDENSLVSIKVIGEGVKIPEYIVTNLDELQSVGN